MYGVPVIAVHPDRDEIVVHGGAVYLLKDSVKLSNSVVSYGKAVFMNGLKWNVDQVIGVVKFLSQGHGMISTNKSIVKRLNTGDIIAIIPVHLCLTSNLMKQFMLTDGNLIEMMK